MEIFQIIGLALVATIIALLLKSHRPEMALQISLVTGIIIFLVILGKITAVVDLLNSYAERVNIDMVYINTLLKIVGIAYIAEFGAEVCRDAGEGAIASKVELAGKVIIVVMAVPIITSLLDLIISVMP
ncbi:stage III sporulation protein AD [Acetivibrio mesophilus]|uniref:Stage III sporulation protein AD n=1 Tax=Acetivibrio mesophilus TaxID=2487273 RepID=A0A4Q0I5T9_9FIRM|nr:stage III sporulation protein AD [Acetivibrio mesophilus]ODM25299.1 stage III sporulation protein AD [Clostridium sp. Bc-iso-3]RXE59681.1 stage III sporulation protein AD [Acetivibrio mesophilus]HHV28598.1 stage III sporulation protein AD [Clostridium sp.]